MFCSGLSRCIVIMCADLCLILGDNEQSAVLEMGAGGVASPTMGVRGITPWKFWKFLSVKPCILGNICAIIYIDWSTKLAHLKHCWINFLLNSYITLVWRCWHNRKATYAKLAFIITENIHKLLVLWQNIGGNITYLVPNKLLGDVTRVPPVPPVSAPMVMMYRSGYTEIQCCALS